MEFGTFLLLIAFAYGIWPGQNQFLQGCAMILTLFGVVLTQCGWRIMHWAWFPIAYLICGIPWPPLVSRASVADSTSTGHSVTG